MPADDPWAGDDEPWADEDFAPESPADVLRFFRGLALGILVGAALWVLVSLALVLLLGRAGHARRKALGRGVPQDAAGPMDAGELRPVRLRIPDPSLREELSGHFVRSGFVVHAVGVQELGVERPDAPSDEQGRREVAAHLLVWELLHPECPGEIVE